MGASLLIARSRLRSNVVAVLLLAVVAGLGGGVVMASISGMRRADEAWATFKADNAAGDAVIGFVGRDGELVHASEDDLADEAQRIAGFHAVEAVTRAAAVVGMVEGPAGGDAAPIAANAFMDNLAPNLVGRPIIVEGRLPEADARAEVAIDELMADRLGVRAGDRITFTPFRADELEAASDGRDVDPNGLRGDVVVTGIVRGPGDLLPPRTDQHALYSDEPYLLLPPAWHDANGSDVGSYGTFLGVDLDASATKEDLAAEVDEAFGGRGFVLPSEDEVGIPPDVEQAVSRQIRSEGRAVTVFAVAVALVATVLLGMAISRQLASDQTEHQALRSLGLSRRALVTADVLRAAAVAASAVVVGAVVAIGLSPRFPIGVGRRTARDLGLDVDVPVLLVGGVVLALLVVLLAGVAGGRRLRGARGRPAPSIVDRVARLGAPAPATLGINMAFDRTTAAVAGRTAVVTGALAVAVTAATVTVLASFDDLQRTPKALGQVWDASAGNFASPRGLEAGLTELEEMEGVVAVAGERGSTATLGGRETPVVAYDPYVGQLDLHLEEGRAPTAVDEIVLGAKLARALDVQVGDRIAAAWDAFEGPETMTVAGIGAVGAMGFEVDPGESALVASELVAQDPDGGVSVLLVRFDEPSGARLAELRDRFPLTVLAAPVPSRSLQTLDGLRVLPVALAAVVGLLALAAGANAALTSVRRRRRDLAVVKVFGLQRREVRRVVVWQALAWASAALAAGLPIGLLLGSAGWRAVLRYLGLDSDLVLPAGALVALAIAAPTALLALTWWPGRQAAATAPAVTLRSE